MTDEEKKNDQIDKNDQTHRDDQIDKNDQIDQMKTNDQMNRQSEKSDSLEDKSLEELHKQIEKGKRKASRSIVFAAAALIAIVSIGVAWFASNSTVTATGSRISAEAPISFLLGSEGQRQNGEQDYLKNGDGNILQDGKQKIYNTWVDVEAKKKIENGILEGGKSLYTGTSNLAWRLNGQESLVPGANGKLEFYIIPQQSGIKVAEITLKLKAYMVENRKATESANTILNNLISGHILLFQHLDDIKGYSGWLKPSDNGEYTFTVTNPTLEDQTDSSNEEFVKDTAYKITLYWVWPNYFRNYIYTQRSTHGDLFTDETSKDRSELIKFANAQLTWGSSKLFYDKDKASDSDTISGDVISAEMLDSAFETYSSYYNQADEYIGTNTEGTEKYVYIEVNATRGTVSSESNAGSNDTGN